MGAHAVSFRTGTCRKAYWRVSDLDTTGFDTSLWKDGSACAAPRFRALDNFSVLQIIAVGPNSWYVNQPWHHYTPHVGGDVGWDDNLALFEAQRLLWPAWNNVQYLILHFPSEIMRNGQQIFDSLVPADRTLPSYFNVRQITSWGVPPVPPEVVPTLNMAQLDAAYLSVRNEADRAYDVVTASYADQIELSNVEHPFGNGIDAVTALQTWHASRFKPVSNPNRPTEPTPPGSVSHLCGRFFNWVVQGAPNVGAIGDPRWLLFPIHDMGAVAPAPYNY